MFFIILGNLEPRPLACAARHDQRAVRDAGQPGNASGSAALHALPRAAARCGARHRGGGNLRGTVGRSAQPWTGGRLLVGAQQCMYERSCFLSGVTRRCRACSPTLQRPACVRLLGSRGCSVLPSTSRDRDLLDFWTERLAGSGRLRADDAVA